jgi:hypothetical protein
MVVMKRSRRMRGDEGCTSPRSLVARGTIFCRLAVDIFSIIIAVIFLYIPKKNV